MSVKVIMSKKREERKRLACLNTGTFAIDEGVALFASKDLALAVSACRSAESDTGKAGAVGSDGGDAGNYVCVTVGATTTALELRSGVDALEVSIVPHGSTENERTSKASWPATAEFWSTRHAWRPVGQRPRVFCLLASKSLFLAVLEATGKIPLK
jgi:hypothetical protein